jgi:uncharacterized protein (DUF1501 family)
LSQISGTSMSDGNINRRGLLGILAAAPIVAALKPAADRGAALFDHQGKRIWLSGGVVGEAVVGVTVKPSETLRQIVANAHSPTRPPEGTAPCGRTIGRPAK